MHHPIAFASFLALAIPFAGNTVWADTSAPAAASMGDVVKLHDGSIFRGTIEELVTGDHVILLMSSGARRRFPMSEVAYVGAAEASSPPPGAPPPPPPPPPTNAMNGPGMDAPSVAVKFEADQPNLEYELKIGQSNFYAGKYSGISQDYQSLCVAPCTGHLPVGTHHIGLSSVAGFTVLPGDPVTISGPGTLQGTYTSRRASRIGGLTTLLVGDVIGAIVIGAGFSPHGSHQDCSLEAYGGSCITTPNGPNGTVIGAGFAIAGVGSLVGLILMLQPDTATVSFIPGNPAASTGLHLGGGPLASTTHIDPLGGSLQVRF